MNRLSKALLACALVAAVGQRASAQAPYWIESFVAPTGTPVLQSFTWGGFSTTNPYTFGLFGFDGSQLTTAALWSQSMTNNPQNGDIQTFTPNTLLTPGAAYAIGVGFVQSAGQTSLYGNPFPGGQFYRTNGIGYTAGRADEDIENFSVTFGTVPPPPITTPEPASLVLLGTGFAGLVGMRRCTRRSMRR